MPKIVDHDARRAHVVDAALRVIARDGLDRATMRAIATEASCTTGLVTHYFADRHELILGALRAVHRRSAARMVALVDHEPPAGALTAVLREALPLDAERRTEWAVWLAFWGASVGDDALRDEHRRRYREWRALVRDLIGRGVAHGELRADLDLDAETDRLLALVDGLGLQATVEPTRLGPRRLTELVDGHLRSLA